MAVRLRPLLSRKESNLLVRGSSWTLADDHERDHDGLAVWESGGLKFPYSWVSEGELGHDEVGSRPTCVSRSGGVPGVRGFVLMLGT